MNLKKGDNVLCVENNSTVRPLVIESVGDKIVFSKQLDKGVKKTFGLKEGSFQLIKPRYISEHEKEEYKNPYLEMNDRVKVIHVEGTDNTNLLGRDGIVISITENERGDREIMLYMEDTQHMANLELEYRMGPYLSSKLIQKSLVLKLDEPKAKQEDYIDGLLHIPEQTEEKKQKISPDLEVGERIMAWDIHKENSPPNASEPNKSIPSTFIATVIDVLDTYNPAYNNGIKYVVKLEDTDEVVGLYGGEWLGGSIHPIRDMYQKGSRDKWLKLPKIGITEDTDIFGQGLLDPIEPEEFEGEEEEWEKMVGDVEEPEVEPEYEYTGGKTDPEVGFVAPSAEVTDNICQVKGFCEAQGPITFGQLKSLVEEATKKRIQADIGRGVFKSLWRIVPFFIPQVLLAAVGVTVTRAFNKIITPSLKNTRGYKNWWGKVVLKAMDVAEGDYIPDVALGDDPLSKIFFVSDGLLQMIRDKYKLKFARYVSEYASTRPDTETVPEWFVENLLRDYLNQKFLLDPPLEPKEDTDFQMIREHEEEMDPEDGIQTREPFTRTEAQILNYLAKEFTWEELNTISSIDETQIYGDLDKKWNNTLKLFGQAPKGDDESWIRSTRWAKWAVENWEEAKVEMDGGGYSQDFKKVTNPIKSWPSWFEVDANESYWQKEYRSGTIEIGAYDREDAEERAEISWWDYDPDMDHYDYGDTDDHELEMRDVRYMKALNEHKESKKLNPELMVGDEIMVVSTEGIHDFGVPELYKPYVVVGIKHGTTMMKGGKELEDSQYYQVEPIGMTDEERLGHMLAGGGRRRPLYIFHRKDEWILRKGFLRGEGLNEHVPKPGSSSAEGIKDDSLPYETDYLNLDEILSSIKSIPYYNEVLTDLKDDKEDWAVTQTVKRYADYWMKNPETLTSDDFPPIQVIGDGLKDGAHRISTLNALAKHIDPDNPYWKEVKLEVRFYQPEIVKDIGPTWVNGELVYNTDEGLQSKSAQELEEFCPMGNPNKCTPVDYDKLPDMLHEHKGVRDMKGFTPKLIGYLKFLFETKEISNDYEFVNESSRLFNITQWEGRTLYLILVYNSNHTGNKEMLEMLYNMPIKDYAIPSVWEYDITYYGDYDQGEEEEDCSGQGYGEVSGEDCECQEGVRYVQDEDGDEVEEDCDYPEDDDCQCQEFFRKSYEVYYNNVCTKTILSTTKLENTHKGSDKAYGYEQMYEIDGELNDTNSIVEHEDCELDYEDGNVWEYFNERDDDIIGMDTDKWDVAQIPKLLEKINNKIYGIKPLIDIIEDQYDVMSDRDTKMKDLTSQIFDILDDNFDMFEHPEGEIEYNGKNMGLYSYHNDSFVPFEHIYNPIMQMLEGGIQQEDIEVFVDIITNWVNYVMSEKREYLNEEVNIKSEDSNYSQEDYEKFVDFAHKELNIDKDCPIDVEAEKSTEYTTGNYHIEDKKIKVLDNGRKLADILRTIAHELVHHKQNELGMLVGDIPEIGGKIEDQANAYAGRLVKKYGKQTPNLYTESRIDIISEEKVVGFNNPNNNFVVIAGGPGAGKSFITKNLVNLENVKEFNVDQVRVMTAKKLWGDEWEEKISTEEGYDEILRRTFTTSDPRNLTVKFLKQFLQSERDQPVNVVYDAGGGQEQVMKDIHQLAKENGFTTTLVHVRTPLDVAQERNIDRPRSLPPEMVAQYHQQVKDNMRNMIPIFDNVWTVDNKEIIDLSNRPTDNIEKVK